VAQLWSLGRITYDTSGVHCEARQATEYFKNMEYCRIGYYVRASWLHVLARAEARRVLASYMERFKHYGDFSDGWRLGTRLHYSAAIEQTIRTLLSSVQEVSDGNIIVSHCHRQMWPLWRKGFG
jgi:hypothetical protein